MTTTCTTVPESTLVKLFEGVSKHTPYWLLVNNRQFYNRSQDYTCYKCGVPKTRQTYFIVEFSTVRYFSS